MPSIDWSTLNFSTRHLIPPMTVGCTQCKHASYINTKPKIMHLQHAPIRPPCSTPLYIPSPYSTCPLYWFITRFTVRLLHRCHVCSCKFSLPFLSIAFHPIGGIERAKASVGATWNLTPLDIRLPLAVVCHSEVNAPHSAIWLLHRFSSLLNENQNSTPIKTSASSLSPRNVIQWHYGSVQLHILYCCDISNLPLSLDVVVMAFSCVCQQCSSCALENYFHSTSPLLLLLCLLLLWCTSIAFVHEQK